MLDPSGIPIPSHDQNQNVSRHCQKVPWEIELPQVETHSLFYTVRIESNGLEIWGECEEGLWS